SSPASPLLPCTTLFRSRGDPAALLGPKLVIGGELERVTALGGELVDVLGAGGESAVGGVDFLIVEIGDQTRGEVDHLVDAPPDRSEEHTSELQSLRHLV